MHGKTLLRGSLLRVKLTPRHRFLKHLGPLAGNIVPVKLSGMADRGIAKGPA
jgi:hypothetical protein